MLQNVLIWGTCSSVMHSWAAPWLKRRKKKKKEGSFFFFFLAHRSMFYWILGRLFLRLQMNERNGAYLHSHFMGLRKKKCIKGDVAKVRCFEVESTFSSGGDYVEWGSNRLRPLLFLPPYICIDLLHCIASRFIMQRITSPLSCLKGGHGNS